MHGAEIHKCHFTNGADLRQIRPYFSWDAKANPWGLEAQSRPSPPQTLHLLVPPCVVIGHPIFGIVDGRVWISTVCTCYMWSPYPTMSPWCIPTSLTWCDLWSYQWRPFTSTRGIYGWQDMITSLRAKTTVFIFYDCIEHKIEPLRGLKWLLSS